MSEKLTFKVSHLYESGIGASEKYSFDADLDFEEMDAKSTIKGGVEIMRIEKGFNVVVENVEVDLNVKCGKCLKEYSETVQVPHGERQFTFKPPEIKTDINDIFLVDRKNQEIDIAEILRQELILHFPVNRVCSSRCKGICLVCGNDKNAENCSCKIEEIEEEQHKPLAALKELTKLSHAKASNTQKEDSKENL